MQITAVSSYLLPALDASWVRVKPYLLVKVETDEGITGWGEAFTLGRREPAIQVLVQLLGQSLVGRDPRQINSIVTDSVSTFGERRTGIEFHSALSGIETALWDVLGKSLHTPARQLLGGVCNEKIPVYANVWSDQRRCVEEVIDKCQQYIAAGHRALKIYPFVMAADAKAATEAILCICKVLDDGIEIMLDLGRNLSADSAIRMAAAVEDMQRINWFEEPVASTQINMLARINKSTSLSVVTGETLCMATEFYQVFQQNAADILNPDPTVCGMGELVNIAAMASLYDIGVGPHNYNCMLVGGAAAAQVSAVLTRLERLEYFPEQAQAWPELGEPAFDISDGYALLNDRPGLGMSVNESWLVAHAVVV